MSCVKGKTRLQEALDGSSKRYEKAMDRLEDAMSVLEWETIYQLIITVKYLLAVHEGNPLEAVRAISATVHELEEEYYENV